MDNLSFSFNLTNSTEFINDNLLKAGANVKISYIDLVRDYAQQIDQKIILLCCMVLFFWVMVNYIAPKAEEFYSNSKWIHKDIVKTIFNKFYSFTERMALMSALFMVILGLIQYGYDKLSVFTKAFICLNLMFTLIIFIEVNIKFIKWLFKKKDKKEIIEDLGLKGVNDVRVKTEDDI